MSICYDFVLELIAEIKNKPYNMNKFAKDGLLSSSLSYLFCYTQRKGIKGKSLIPFLARKERLDRASPVLLASQALTFFVPFASQKMDY